MESVADPLQWATKQIMLVRDGGLQTPIAGPTIRGPSVTDRQMKNVDDDSEADSGSAIADREAKVSRAVLAQGGAKIRQPLQFETKDPAVKPTEIVLPEETTLSACTILRVTRETAVFAECQRTEMPGSNDKPDDIETAAPFEAGRTAARSAETTEDQSSQGLKKDMDGKTVSASTVLRSEVEPVSAALESTSSLPERKPSRRRQHSKQVSNVASEQEGKIILELPSVRKASQDANLDVSSKKSGSSQTRSSKRKRPIDDEEVVVQKSKASSKGAAKHLYIMSMPVTSNLHPKANLRPIMEEVVQDVLPDYDVLEAEIENQEPAAREEPQAKRATRDRPTVTFASNVDELDAEMELSGHPDSTGTSDTDIDLADLAGVFSAIQGTVLKAAQRKHNSVIKRMQQAKTQIVSMAKSSEEKVVKSRQTLADKYSKHHSRITVQLKAECTAIRKSTRDLKAALMACSTTQRSVHQEANMLVSEASSISQALENANSKARQDLEAAASRIVGGMQKKTQEMKKDKHLVAQISHFLSTMIP